MLDPARAAGPHRGLFYRLAALNALCLGTFGIIAPAGQSVFLGAFDASWLPYAWLAVMAAAAAATALLRVMRRHVSLAACFAGMAWLDAATLAVLLSSGAEGNRVVAFIIYVWRDVYILVLLELLWMLVNVGPLAKNARPLYGWLSAAGTGGTVLTSIVGGALAQPLGTRALLWAMVPALALVGVLARRVATDGAVRAPAPPRGGPETQRAFTPALGGVLAVVGLGHVCLTLLDFQVNQAVQAQLPGADRRTEVMSFLHSATNLVGFSLQLGSGRLLGLLTVGGALALMPVWMVAGVASFGAWGGLWPLLATRLMVKSTDHSLYRIAKEETYLPLSWAEKTAGKGWVDIFGSRLAKAAASLALI